MLTNTGKKSLLKVLVAGTCSAVITLATLTADATAGTLSINIQHSAATVSTTTSPLEQGSCLYSIQLAADPALKAAFTAKINAIRGGATSEDDGELIYTTNIEAGGAAPVSFNEPAKSVDNLSNDCLSCHDGIMAQSFNVRIKNNPRNRVMGLEDIIGGHPVGMEYDKYVSVSEKDYRGDVKFSREMVFADGKVGCLTCHNPLNKDKGHLVMNNSRSELCFTCHSK